MLLCQIGCHESSEVGDRSSEESTTVSWNSMAPENLAADASCAACHSASDEVRSRLGIAPSPVILGDDGVGARLSPDAIRARLDAHGGEIGLRMPDLLHGLSDDDRSLATEELVHFLASQGGPLDRSNSMIEVSTADISKGEVLWREIGCVACHGVDAATAPGMQNLAGAWTHESLTRFLADPLAVHPAGRMPALNLNEDEASSISAYLLTLPPTDGTPPTATIASRPGLTLEYWKKAYEGIGPMDETGPPDLETRVPTPQIGPGKGQDNFGLRFAGEIEIPTDGRWNFYLRSDDGSGLRIGDQLVVDHGGIHGASVKRGAIDLTAGRHPITISMFERAGGEELSVSWSGPGIDRQPIPAKAFSSNAAVLDPGWRPFEPDEQLAQAGMMRFASLGCSACHVPEMPLAGRMAKLPPLDSLSAGSGCLATTVPASAPDYGFTEDERALLDDLVRHGSALSEPLPANLEVAHSMTRLNCIACHARDGVGGPSAEQKARFVSNDEAELGDEGRLPPSLHDVGNKLRLAALEQTMAEGTKVRPYMKARMPVFGDVAIGDLPTALAAVDAVRRGGAEPSFDPELAKTGHVLVGTDGVSCVQCHTASGHPALGIPAVDLTTMHDRLRPGWFKAHLLDPQKTNPGTRMTAFWGNGGTDRIFPEILGGDPEKQVDAIRTYLSLGESMPIPKGVIPEAGEYALIPGERPIVFGTFMAGISPRTIAVGLPENVHYAYDAENGRLARAWRGDFMDARGTWHGRAGQLEQPEGSSVIDFPDGPAISPLENRNAPWPEAFARDAAGIRNGPWRFAGRSTDQEGRPVFHMEIDGARISEHPIPRLAAGGTRLVRKFTVASDVGRGDLYARLAVGPAIEPAGGEGSQRRWTVEGFGVVLVSGADSFVRETADGDRELMVKVPFRMVGRDDAMFEGTFEVETGW